jgi:hypothetical protein
LFVDGGVSASRKAILSKKSILADDMQYRVDTLQCSGGSSFLYRHPPLHANAAASPLAAPSIHPYRNMVLAQQLLHSQLRPAIRTPIQPCTSTGHSVPTSPRARVAAAAKLLRELLEHPSSICFSPLLRRFGIEALDTCHRHFGAPYKSQVTLHLKVSLKIHSHDRTTAPEAMIVWFVC